MKTYLEHKYFKELERKNVYNYFKIYGTFVNYKYSTEFYCDIIGPDTIEEKVWITRSMVIFEEITEKEWEESYKKSYETILENLRGKYFKSRSIFGFAYYKINDIIEKTVIYDSLIDTFNGKIRLKQNNNQHISYFASSVCRKEITEEEWNKVYNETI